jgi:hypothetical protein
VTGQSGPWQAHVKFRGDEGAVETASVNVVGPSDAMIGRPIVYRAGSAAALPFQPASIFHFRRTERVRFDWPLREPLQNHSVRLLDRAGAQLPVEAKVATRQERGQQVLSTEFNLAPLNKGDYLIELTGRAGGKTEQHLIAIRVAMAR